MTLSIYIDIDQTVIEIGGLNMIVIDSKKMYRM